MNSILAILLIGLGVGAGFAIVTLFGLWQAAKREVDRLAITEGELSHALGVAQGYIESLSTLSLPGVTDSALTTLARLDALTKGR